jgi:cytochrome c biogenesis protein ResB
MVLVVACTLAQVSLGTKGAVDMFMRSFIVWWRPEGWSLSLPIFPGGALVGLVLAANLIAAQTKRLAFSFNKFGLWIVHAGLILLVAAEFVSAAFQIDARMPIEEGQTMNYVERTDGYELALTDGTDPAFDDVYGVPDTMLRPGTQVAIDGTPITMRVLAYYRNAELNRRKPSDPPAMATQGIGSEIDVRPAPPVTSDDSRDNPTAIVEFLAGGRSYGTWLVAAALGAPQSFFHEGHSYAMSLRARREYLPYSLTLKKFSHDVYAGTDIPKNFSSLVHLVDPGHSEERDVLIFMNQPLRYAGRTFYQASFGKNDTLSILQVVQNPGWQLPYISCALVAFGLLFHFTLSLRRSQRSQKRVAVPAV